MATREEIREQVYQQIELAILGVATNIGYNPQTNWGDLIRVARTELAKKLDKLGAVIRVKCPDCSWYKFEDEVVGMTPCHSCNSTGYIVKPLIEDGKDNSGK